MGLNCGQLSQRWSHCRQNYDCGKLPPPTVTQASQFQSTGGPREGRRREEAAREKSMGVSTPKSTGIKCAAFSRTAAPLIFTAKIQRFRQEHGPTTRPGALQRALFLKLVLQENDFQNKLNSDFKPLSLVPS